MTLPEALAILVRAEKIRSAWLPGMLTQHRERVLARVTGGRLLVQPDDIEHESGRVIGTDGPIIVRADDGGPRRPDLSDPLTVCGLLLLAREAWGDPSLTPMPIDESIPLQWDWCDDGLLAPALMSGIYYRPFDSEADAIVAAIIAAAEALPQ